MNLIFATLILLSASAHAQQTSISHCYTAPARQQGEELESYFNRIDPDRSCPADSVIARARNGNNYAVVMRIRSSDEFTRLIQLELLSTGLTNASYLGGRPIYDYIIFASGPSGVYLSDGFSGQRIHINFAASSDRDAVRAAQALSGTTLALNVTQAISVDCTQARTERDHQACRGFTPSPDYEPWNEVARRAETVEVILDSVASVYRVNSTPWFGVCQVTDRPREQRIPLCMP